MELDQRKFDASLANEWPSLGEGESLTVFIHFTASPSEEQVAFLRRLGVSNAKPGQKIVTATLPKKALAELSAQPWVQALRLSRTLRLLQAE